MLLCAAGSSAIAFGLYLYRQRGSISEPDPLLGPPYRWLLPDCGCFYSENLYVKTAAGKSIDAYFTLTSPDTTDSEFWTDNAQVVGSSTGIDDRVKQDILHQVRKESLRRLELSDTYRHNFANIQRTYKPLFPALFEAYEVTPGARQPDLAPGVCAEQAFRPEFLQAWRCATGAQSSNVDYRDTSRFKGGTVLSTMKHVHCECFEVPIFTDWFVAMIHAEIKHFKQFASRIDLAHQWPNNMNRAGLILNEIGLGPFMDRLIQHYLGPVCSALYPRLLGDGFEAHHSFVVQYSMTTDRSLGVHDDNSEVTVNISLSDRYTGAELAMYHHARVKHPQQESLVSYKWRVSRAGNMLLHPGEMLHEVKPLESGDRMGLIVWLRSTRWREREGCPLCGSSERLLYEIGPMNCERRRAQML